MRFNGCAPWWRWRFERVRRAGWLILGLDDNVVIETKDSLIPFKPSRSSTPADSIFSRAKKKMTLRQQELLLRECLPVGTRLQRLQIAKQRRSLSQSLCSIPSTHATGHVYPRLCTFVCECIGPQPSDLAQRVTNPFELVNLPSFFFNIRHVWFLMQWYDVDILDNPESPGHRWNHTERVVGRCRHAGSGRKRGNGSNFVPSAERLGNPIQSSSTDA